MATAPAGSLVMISRWQRYAHDHPRATDVAAGLVLAGVSLPGVALSVHGTAGPPRVPGMLLTGAACASLLWHRGHPRATAALTTACTIAVASLGYVLTPLLLGPAIAGLFLLAVRAGQKASNAFTAVTITAVVWAALIAGPADESLALKTVGPAAWLLLGPALGAVARLRLAYLNAAQARAEYAERTREEEARLRVAEERVRIARDLHDVVAHHLALANAQAGAVAHLMTTQPGQARKIASDLTGTTSSALRELKATVGLLRQASDLDAPLEPPPGLARIPDLIASFQSAGLAVHVATEGEPRPLSPGVDLTAFRIVQEALTNVAKHAATAEAHVQLRYAGDRLAIAVSNSGGGQGPAARAEPGAGAGYGLIGMRERALSVGGRLRAGHRPAGVFEVTAELPLPPRAPEAAERRPSAREGDTG
jgi:signal transduction histidine kinase